MRRAVTDFILRGVLIVGIVGGLAYLASGSGAMRPRRAATARPSDPFTPGAKASLTREPVLVVDAERLRELTPLVRRIHRDRAPLPLMERIFARDDFWLDALIVLLLSDDEPVARGAGETLVALFERRGIHGDRGGPALGLEGFGDPDVRAQLFETLAAWYMRNRRAVEAWGEQRFRRICRANVL
jgi:hypothetical protein